MTTYRVTRIVDATQTLEVEIDDKDMTTEQIVTAVNLAADDHPDAGVGLCYQCSCELEAGDVQDTVSIYRDGQKIWTDTDQPAPALVVPLLDEAIAQSLTAAGEAFREASEKIRAALASRET